MITKQTLLDFIKIFKAERKSTLKDFKDQAAWGRYENMDIRDLKIAKKYLIK